MEDDFIIDPEQFEFTEIPTAAELLGINTELYGDSFNAAEEVYEDEFGDEATELTPEQKRELRSLRNEYARLTSPVPQKAPIGGFVPNNEFSVSTRGLSTGLNDLFGAVTREKRKNQLFGDPEQRKQIAEQIKETSNQADRFADMRDRTRAGDITLQELGVPNPDVYTPEEANEIREQYAQQFDTQAQQLQEETSTLEATYKDYEGVAGRLEELEELKTEADEQDKFAEQFRLTFGDNMFKSVRGTIDDRAARRSAETRTLMQQVGATERTKITQREITQRAADRLRSSNESQEFDAEDATPNLYKPRPIQATMQSYKNEIKDGIQELKDNYFTIQEGVDYVEFPPDVAITYFEENGQPEKAELARQAKVEITKLAEEEFLAEQIRLSAVQWQDSGFSGDSLPPLRPPNAAQETTLYNMMQSGIPQQAVSAWMFYNRIDVNAPPPVPDEAKNNSEAGDY